MKKLLLLTILLMFIACSTNESKQDKNSESEIPAKNDSEERELSINTDSQFGDEFESAEVKTADEMMALYDHLKLGDTIRVQFQSEVESVCANKGCWMKLELPEDQNVHVTFKDYGFFVPKDSQGHQMLVDGVAFIEQTDVKTLKHYAEDAGKSEKEIAEITEPELNYRFIATGVKVSE